MTDKFKGDNAALAESIDVMIGLSAADALTPRVPAMAIQLLEAASSRLVESEAREGALREALQPFEDLADLLESETEGFADDDKLNLVTGDGAGNIALADVSFGDFRRAALTLKGV